MHTKCALYLCASSLAHMVPLEKKKKKRKTNSQLGNMSSLTDSFGLCYNFWSILMDFSDTFGALINNVKGLPLFLNGLLVFI